MNPESTLDLNEAIEQFDLESYLLKHGGTQLQTLEWVLVCPGCGKEKLTVNVEAKAWHCWVCEGIPGARGKGGLLDLMAKLDGVNRAKAAQDLLAEARFKPQGYVLDELVVQQGYRPPRPIPPPEYWEPADGRLPYLAKRGILPDDARAFGLAWCRAGRYANRLIFPVWEEGQLVYYQGRAMWEEADRPQERYIKALNPPKEDGAAVSSEVLMNLDVARHYPRVAVVEGPIDAVKTGPSAVCTFGKKISGLQISKLVRAGVRALDLMWDGPGPKEPQGAWPEMHEVAPLLATLFDLRLVYLPFGDPGQRDRAELEWHRQRAQPFTPMLRL